MRVFVSSTVYDLVDIRAEVAEELRALGISPVMSDDKLSDFDIPHDANSIETCLINVDSCDHVIVILDQRYGPSLKSAGFDDVSATHLEYRRAVKAEKPIHFYIRDRLEAEYKIWKGNDAARLSWVKPNDTALFKLMEEHRALRSTNKRSNWFATFKNSVDLRASIRHRLEKTVRPQQLINALAQNAFPLIDTDVDTEQLEGVWRFKVTTILRNVCAAPAFNFTCRLDQNDEPPVEKSVLAPDQSVTVALIKRFEQPGECSIRIRTEYDSALGVSVADVFEVLVHLIVMGTNTVINSHATLISRQFKHTQKPVVEIND